MKKRKLKRKISHITAFIIIINVLSMCLWYQLRIKPLLFTIKDIEKEITEQDLNYKYQCKEELLSDIELISNKYNIKFSLKNIYEEELTDYKITDKDTFLFIKVINIEDDFYILKAYLNRKINTLNIVIELILFQILVVTLFMFLILIFTRNKIIKPTEKIIDEIRNYKLGHTPKKVNVNNEFDLIHNEFVTLVDTLEEEKNEQNRIISSISHDIKTPLTSIIGYSSLIEENKLTKEEIINYNKKINSKALHIKNLLNTFDEYLANHNNQTLKLDIIRIKDIIDDLNNDYKIELENNNIDFFINTKLSDEYVLVDVLKLKRIFSNMISNSVRFIKDRKGLITISITKEDKYYKFVVSDNGCGVDEEILSKIFEPLFTTDKSRKNSGLGLSICKEFVEMHGGSIRAYNNITGLSIEFMIPFNE